jgi:hypothetical protein
MQDFFTITFFVSTVIFALLVTWLMTPKMKGWIAEYLVKKLLIKLAKKFNGFQYHDVMLGLDQQSTQIDNILVTEKAVYIIEVKNYSGRVYGQQYQDQWFQTIRYENKKKNKKGKVYTKSHIAKHNFLNPIKQNLIHIHAFKNQITSAQNLPIFNIVVFTNRTNIENITLVDDKAIVIARRLLKKTIDHLERKLNKQPIDLISLDAEIVAKNTKSKANVRKHIQKIKSKYPNRK